MLCSMGSIEREIERDGNVNIITTPRKFWNANLSEQRKRKERDREREPVGSREGWDK